MQPRIPFLDYRRDLQSGFASVTLSTELLECFDWSLGMESSASDSAQPKGELDWKSWQQINAHHLKNIKTQNTKQKTVNKNFNTGKY